MELLLYGFLIFCILSVVFEEASMHFDRKNMRQQIELYQNGVNLDIKDVHELYERISNLHSTDIRSVECVQNDLEYVVQVLGKEATHYYYIRDGLIYVDYPKKIFFINRGLLAIFKHFRF